MTEGTFEHRFVAKTQSDILAMKRMADRAMVLYILLRLGLVVGSASLPALTVLGRPSWVPTVVAVGVAILAALDTQFRWGEEWRHFRSTQLTLAQFLLNYDRELTDVEHGPPGDAEQAGRAAFDRFYGGVNKLSQAETESFFKFRIVEWKADKA